MTREPPALRTVVFDLDGTLVDSEGLILASYRHTMSTHLGDALPDDLWRATMGRPLAVQLRDFARSADEAAAMLATYTSHNLANHDRLVRPFPGVREALAGLRERGLVLAIATSKRAEATGMGLRACDLPADWFASIVTADDVQRFKPEPEPVLRALERAGQPDATRAVYVGDSVHDMQSGKAAGTWIAAALWGPNGREVLAPAGPDVWLERPEEIADLPGRLAGRVRAPGAATSTGS